MNRYPDMGNTRALRRAGRQARRADRAARRWRPARSALIYQLVQAFCEPGDEVVYAWRCFEAYPIAVTAAGATSVQVPVHRRRPPRPRRDGGGDHRPHQGRPGLHAQQPDRPGGDPGRARRVPGPGARRTCWSSSTRPTSSSCGWTTRSTASRPCRAHDNVVVDPHLLQGLRAGRLPGRVRRRPGADRRRAAGGVACRSASPASPRPPRSPRSRRGPSCSSGSTRWSPSAPRRRRPSARPAGRPGGPGQLRVVAGPGDRTAAFAAAAEAVGIVVRPFAGDGVRVSASASPRPTTG